MKMKMRVWWIPQVQMKKRFEVDVTNEFQANLMLNTLADYDQFQLDNNIKPDYSNMGGVEMFVDGEWRDWYNDEYDDFDDYRREVLET